MTKRAALVLVVSLLSTALYLSLVAYGLDSPDASYIFRFLITTQVILTLYLLLLTLIKRFENGDTGRRWFWITVGIALVIRGILFVGVGESSFLSDDVYRYIWEGKILSHGYNPFLLSPYDMWSSGLVDDKIYPLINHPWLPTIYPPLSQYLFVIAYLIGDGSLYGFKIIALIADLTTIILLFVIIREQKLALWQSLIYILSPLVLIEFIFSNHLDILAMPFLVATLIFLYRKNAVAVGLFLSMAVAIKLFALFFLPIIFVGFNPRERIRFLASFAALLLILYLPFLLVSGTETFGSLWTYLQEWQFNASFFALFKLIVGETIARYICGILFVLAIVFLSLYRRKHGDTIDRCFWAFAIYLLLTPSMFSWYLVWLLPFLVIKPRLPFLVFTGTVLLSYHVKIGYYNDGVWVEYWYLRLLEYLPLFGLLGYQLLFHRKPQPRRIV